MQLRLEVFELLALDRRHHTIAAGPAILAIERLDQGELLALGLKLGRELVLAGRLPERFPGERHLGPDKQYAFGLGPSRLEPGDVLFAAVGLDGFLDNGLRIA